MKLNKFNVLLLFFLCFFAITTLFLFIDSNQSGDLEQVLIECTDNHDHHVTDCIELTQPTSEEIVKSSDQQEEELLAMKKILDETEKTLQERQKLLDKSREELGLK